MKIVKNNSFKIKMLLRMRKTFSDCNMKGKLHSQNKSPFFGNSQKGGVPSLVSYKKYYIDTNSKSAIVDQNFSLNKILIF